MKTKRKLNIKVLTLLTLFLSSSIYVSAQNSSTSTRKSTVQPLSEFLESYKDKYRIISEEIESMTELSFAEKLALYDTETSKLKEDFKANRKSEYLSKTAKRAKRFTCTGTHVRNSTDCAPVTIDAPSNNMYTKTEWIKVEGSNQGKVDLDNSSVTLRIKATGKRTYKGVLYATFKYKPENVPAIVNQETTDLFNQMTEK